MKCKNCGTINTKGAKFCEKCGNSLTAKNICPKCGYKNKPTALHCIECGTNLTQPESSSAEPGVAVKLQEKPIKPKKVISPVAWVLGGVFGVILLCLAAFLIGLIKVPVPPEPSASILPKFVVSAWTGAYQFQTTGSFDLSSADTGQGGYMEALYDCDEKGQSPISATTSDKIHDFIEWGAVTQAQVEDFLKYIQFTVTVDGNKVNFQGPFKYEIKFDAKNYYYTTPSLVVLNSLEIGTHHIKTEITWTQKIYDGEDYYGPGSENEKLEGNCTVVVKKQPIVTINDPDEEMNINVQGCNPSLVDEAECIKAGGKLMTTDIGIFDEEKCVCGGVQNEIQCAKDGGAWNPERKSCSTLNQCFNITNENECKFQGGWWNPPWNVCTCRNIPGTKNRCGLIGGKDGGSINSGIIKCKESIPTLVGNQQEVTCSAEVNYPLGFDPNAVFWDMVLLPNNTTDNGIKRNGITFGDFGDDCKMTQNAYSCNAHLTPTEADKFQDGRLLICEDFVCCTSFGQAKVQLTELKVIATPALASNCPQSSDLSASIKDWKSGKMTMEIQNKADWTVSILTTNLKDSSGKVWTSLDCKRKADDSKIMTCIGWAASKTGTASMSFSYSSNGSQCTIPTLSFPIPCYHSCHGSCCQQGYSCCSCGCKLLNSSMSCSSACS